MRKFKFTKYFWVLSVLAWILAGCSGANSTTGSAAPVGTQPPASAAAGILQTNYENALPAASQLAVGLFKLDASSAPLSAEQAAALLPLWKAYRSLSVGEGGSSEEINALIAQIQETLSEDQLKTIAAMQLTGQDLMQLAEENNLVLGGGSGGSGAGLSEEERATRQAQRFSGQGSDPGGFPPPGGGMGAGGGMGPGGEFQPGAMTTPSVRQTAVAQRARTGDARVSPGLVEALIAYLEAKRQ